MILAQVMFDTATERWKSCHGGSEHKLVVDTGNNSRSANRAYGNFCRTLELRKAPNLRQIFQRFCTGFHLQPTYPLPHPTYLVPEIEEWKV